MPIIFPKILVTAALEIDDPAVVGGIMQELVGKKSVKLTQLQKFIVAAAKNEIAERQEIRKSAAERKRRQRAKGE